MEHHNSASVRGGLSTEDIARICHVRSASVREHLSRKGHYFGIRPLRLPNGRLDWPADSRERLLGFRREMG